MQNLSVDQKMASIRMIDLVFHANKDQLSTDTGRDDAVVDFLDGLYDLELVILTWLEINDELMNILPGVKCLINNDDDGRGYLVLNSLWVYEKWYIIISHETEIEYVDEFEQYNVDMVWSDLLQKVFTVYPKTQDVLIKYLIDNVDSIQKLSTISEDIPEVKPFLHDILMKKIKMPYADQKMEVPYALAYEVFQDFVNNKAAKIFNQEVIEIKSIKDHTIASWNHCMNSTRFEIHLTTLSRKICEVRLIRRTVEDETIDPPGGARVELDLYDPLQVRHYLYTIFKWSQCQVS